MPTVLLSTTFAPGTPLASRYRSIRTFWVPAAPPLPSRYADKPRKSACWLSEKRDPRLKPAVSPADAVAATVVRPNDLASLGLNDAYTERVPVPLAPAPNGSDAPYAKVSALPYQSAAPSP